MGNVGSIIGRRDERTHVTGDIGSDGNGWEVRPVTELASNDVVDEPETNRKSPVTRQAPRPFPFYRYPQKFGQSLDTPTLPFLQNV